MEENTRTTSNCHPSFEAVMEEDVGTTNDHENSQLFSWMRDDNHFDINELQLDENIEQELHISNNISEEFIGDEKDNNDDDCETNLETEQCDDQGNIEEDILKPYVGMKFDSEDKA